MQYRKRPPRQSERRAIKTIERDLARLQKPDNTQFLGGFAVMRSASERPDLKNEKLAEFKQRHQNKLFALLGVSVLSGVDGFKIVGHLAGLGKKLDFDETKRQSEERTCGFITATITGTMIAGAQRNTEGPRFPSFCLDEESAAAVKAERYSIYRYVGVPPRDRFKVPHLALCRTYDQQEAEKFVNDMNKSGVIGTTVVLEPGEAIETRRTRTIHARS